MATLPPIVSILAKHIEQPGSPERVRDDHPRASAVNDYCSRYALLTEVHEIYARNTPELPLEIIFAWGKGLHWVAQNELFGSNPAFLGTWRCTGCGHRVGPSELLRGAEWTPVAKPPPHHPHDSDWTYEEVLLVDPELKLQGHPDGYLLEEDGSISVLEFKSIGGQGAAAIAKAPKSEHVSQVHAYFHLTGFSRARIIYFDKGRYGLESVTEHIVERDELKMAEILGPIRETRRLLPMWTGENREILPKRIAACAKHTLKRARNCLCREECWAGELPEEEKTAY